MSTRITRRSNALALQNSAKTEVEVADVQMNHADEDLDDLTEDTLSDNWYEGVDEENSDSGSEYGARSKGSASKDNRPTKRAKKSSNVSVRKTSKSTKASTPKSAPVRRGKKSLSLLPTMPLDVLFEIFSLLTSKDLLAIARTSKNFRLTLMSRNATTVWKAARESAQAPLCPSWVSEPAWAALLFGNTCQSCNAKNVHKIDFQLLRRACVQCKKSHLVVRSRMSSRFPNIDTEIMELVPSTSVGGWAHGHSSSSQFFWDDDVENMVLKVAEKQRDVDMGLPDARKWLGDFKREQKARVHFLEENAYLWASWFDNQSKEKRREANAKQTSHIEQIKQRLQELGYIEADFEFLRWHDEAKSKAVVTDKVWERIRPKIEPEASNRREARLAHEASVVRVARCTVIDQGYKEYKKTVDPMQWKFLPPTTVITLLDPFRTIVEKSAGETVSDEEYHAAFEQLPEVLAARLDEKRANLMNLIAAQGANLSENVPPTSLDKVTSVFRYFPIRGCHSMASELPCLFGWDEVAAYHYPSDYKSLWGSWGPFSQRNRDEAIIQSYVEGGQLTYDPFIVLLVEKVVEAMGLHAGTTTAREVDTKAADIRFACNKCTPSKRAGAWYRLGYTWRALQSGHRSDAAFTILSSPETALLKQSEEGSDDQFTRTRPVWACAKCPAHSDGLQMRDIVFRHLRDSHAIENPAEEVDYTRVVHYGRTGHTARFSVPAPVEAANAKKGAGHGPRNPPATKRCLKCAPNVTRRFIPSGVLAHLRDNGRKTQNIETTGRR
ncbi:hypothetical protein BXZ70DRAFT_1075980 [Cristinia sonorae]|uniref:F-box domain-containing protein n=1 Tax=Cristinia sonorae TaxID=1940300 RepID=A0A8K0XS98_9AGAR|nr:hypothetical protein BXZ70DRAFT_1075980 [Cristinia sonorae]